MKQMTGPSLAVIPELRTALACRLRERQAAAGRRPPPPGAGEVELENTSSEVVEIMIDIHPLQHLDLVVRDAQGKVISEHYYGNLFSPVFPPYVWRLQPGEKYIAPVSFLGNVPHQLKQPGEYTVQAIYEFNGIRAISEPLSVRV